jgi:hypothetical protein
MHRAETTDYHVNTNNSRIKQIERKAGKKAHTESKGIVT